ncbi:MAG: ATP-binding protein [Prevotellaceae bacterium]|jgi:predicted AAA+ superfamily ATPase|nr:ATP-binding protein [Prevotellaceae bacterium]
MKRDILKKLKDWKNSPTRKPLILTGARQVGKTWAIREFGTIQFKNVAYIMFEKNENMRQLFNGSLSPKDLLPFLQAESGETITADTLLVFDEVQAVPNAITSLKFFQEQMPELFVIASGSALGVAMHGNSSFPVGKTDHLQLYPMTFSEFLQAMGEEHLAELLKNTKPEKLNIFHEKFDRYLKQYFFVGGMPEVVAEYAENRDFTKVRTLQNKILQDYDFDFAKYATPLLATKIRLLWNSIPQQIARENKKFIYGAVKLGARARDFETTIQWLLDSSMIHKIVRVSKLQSPLKFYEDFGAFKLFLSDLGLLGAMSGTLPKQIVEHNSIYTEFNGALSEQFVCQELTASCLPALFYWSREDSKQEIDFITESERGVIPVEVKSGTNLAAKSFNEFMKENNSPFGIKISSLPYKENEKTINIPLYNTLNIQNIIK